MIFLWNPTSENLPFQYAGLSYTIEAGKRMKVDEAMGNHVLNSMGPRGLTRLVFDDDGKSINEEQIAADAIERNKEFKIRQVYVYNETNERKKAAGQAYNPPTKQVRQFAAELGIKLLQPYEMAEMEKEQIGKLTEENQELRNSIGVLTKQMTEMMEMIKSGGNSKPDESKKIRCKVCNLRVDETDFERHMLELHKGG
jgi:hypothetical protein